MLTVSISTYKRLDRLNQCIKSLDSKNISEILIFNDDEEKSITSDKLVLKKSQKDLIKIYNPSDFDFSDRKFRKPIYMNVYIDGYCPYRHSLKPRQTNKKSIYINKNK